MSRMHTAGATMVEIDEDISCFIAQRMDPDKSLGDDEPVSVETSDIDRIFQLKLSDDTTYSAIALDKLVWEQTPTCFVEMLSSLLRGRVTSAERSQKTFFSENKEGIICREAHIDNATQFAVPPLLIERLLYVSHYPKTAGHPGSKCLCYTLRRKWY